MDLYQMSGREIYETFIEETAPAEVLATGREGIAAQLMVDGGLDQKAAYYAADQILAFAQALIQDRQI